MNRLVFGIGINDAEYPLRPVVDGKQISCPVYSAWKNMLKRCYWHGVGIENPTYIGVTVCEEWHRFSNFKRWYDEHYVDGWHLDKDLLTDSREYGPSTCIFVPRWLNNFLNENSAKRGGCKIGVHWRKDAGQYHAMCSNPISRKRDHLGLFGNEVDANRAWRSRKMELAYQLKDWMDAIDRRIYFRVTEIIMRAV